jgi:hypothetical protein
VSAPDAGRYLVQVRQQAATLATSMANWEELAFNPRPQDQNWRVNVAAQFTAWKLAYEAARRMNPRDSLSAVQICWVNALGKLSAAGDEYTRGRDEDAPTLIEAGGLGLNDPAAEVHTCAEEIHAAAR